MLPSVGYFKSIFCPYFQDDSCDRPYCQFRHEHPPAKQPKTSAPKIEEPGSSKELPKIDKCSALEEIVSEAVKRVLKENGQLLESLDASKILELVGQQKLVEKVVENLVPASKPEASSSNGKNKAHKTYTVPKGIPAYTPTPIAVLKKTKVDVPKPVASYAPSSVSGSSGVLSTSTRRVPEGYDPTNNVKKPSSSSTYEPSAKTQVPVSYCPSKISASYSPSSIVKHAKKDGNATGLESYLPSEIKYNPEGQSKSSVTYEPSKGLYKTEETYTPSTAENVPNVEYKPSSKTADQSNDIYTPSSNVECGIDYKPTAKELSSPEPSYSPYCSKPPLSSVQYSPSSIKLNQALTTEPTYSPASTNNNRPHVDYAPSSIKLNQALTTEPTYSPISTSQNKPQVEYIPSSAGPPLSPEKYLALLEGLDDTLEEPKRSSTKSEEEKKKERRDKEKEREKERQRRKEKEREREKRKSSSTRSSDSKTSSKHSSSSSSKRHRSSSESKPASKASKSKSSESKEVPRDDVDEDSGSDVDDECYRIFKEYKPTASESQADDQKKRKSEEPPPEPEVVIPVKKQRIAHVASAETPSRPAAPVAAKPPQRLAPGMAMIERLKRAQEARAAAASAASSSGTPSSSFGSSSGTEKRRIAHVPNVMGLLTNRPKIAPVSSQAASSPSSTSSLTKTLQKPLLLNGARRPSLTNASKAPAPAKIPRPTIAIEMNCRVPASIRQRYLNVLCDETLKIYDREEDAYERAVEEEKQAYAKCNSKVVYINVITNLVQKIRREAEGGNSKTPVVHHGVRTVSHSAILDGKKGATESWSIERPRAGKVDSSLLKGAALYKLLERHILTMEQQDAHGYPRPDPAEKGKAIINTLNRFRQKPVAGVKLGPDEKSCDRCGKIYKVNFKGLALRTDDSCTYHWGRQFYRRGEARYSCCQGDSSSEGCCVGMFHITDTANEHQRGGFVRTMAKSPPPDGNYGVYALDCEMCYTTEGSELTRVTVISTENGTVYETLVKPDNPILDYNTRFSGITEEDMVNVKTTIRDVQAVLLSKFSNKTILIGHSFDSDLRALKIIHDTVIDTSVVFPHPKGLPYKKALRTLCGEILQKIIQNDVGGHDSAEDAIACMELMMWKVKQDLKLLKA